MTFYVSPHDAAIAEDKARRCPLCHGTGRQIDFVVSGMRVVAPCDCPLGGMETTVCEIGNPHARGKSNPSHHRRPSNIAGRPKSLAAYWSRMRRPHEVLAELEC
jgi:hypothetical protein